MELDSILVFLCVVFLCLNCHEKIEQSCVCKLDATQRKGLASYCESALTPSGGYIQNFLKGDSVALSHMKRTQSFEAMPTFA